MATRETFARTLGAIDAIAPKPAVQIEDAELFSCRLRYSQNYLSGSQLASAAEPTLDVRLVSSSSTDSRSAGDAPEYSTGWFVLTKNASHELFLERRPRRDARVTDLALALRGAEVHWKGKGRFVVTATSEANQYKTVLELMPIGVRKPDVICAEQMYKIIMGQETTSPPSTPAGGREGRQGRSAAAVQTAAPPPEPETAKEKLKAAKAKAKAKLKAAEASAAARAEAEAEAAAAAATVAEAGAEAEAIAKSSAEQAAAARLAAAKKKASEWKAAAVAGTTPGAEEGDKLERARAKAKASALAATEAAAAAEVQAKAAEEEAARLSALARAKAKTALAAAEAAAAEVAAESAAVQQLAIATAAVAPARPSKRLLKSMKRRDKMLAAMKAAQGRRVAP